MTTLEEAKATLETQIFNGGARCPCCGQFAKVYHRSLNCGMVVSLIRMYRRFGLEWQHIPTTIPARSREEGKLACWGLIEDSDETREDGGRAGYWRVTQKGKAFILGELKVPKYINVYDGVCLGLDGEMVSIKDCLGTKFDLQELMGS